MFKIYDKLTEEFVFGDDGEVFVADTIEEAIKYSAEVQMPIIVDVDGDYTTGKIESCIDKIDSILSSADAVLTDEECIIAGSVVDTLGDLLKLSKMKRGGK